MLGKTILSHLNGNRKTIEERAFSVAFIPNKTQQNTARLWAEKLAESRKVITQVSSLCHKWQMAGAISQEELTEALELLDRYHLDTLLDELISLAGMLDCAKELEGQR